MFLLYNMKHFTRSKIHTDKDFDYFVIHNFLSQELNIDQIQDQRMSLLEIFFNEQLLVNHVTIATIFIPDTKKFIYLVY